MPADDAKATLRPAGVTLLFRPEAVDGQRQSWLGGVQLVRPLSMTLLTVFTVSVAALVIGYLFVGEYTRKAHVSGVLVPDLGLIRLVPPEAATVLANHAREGQRVTRGDVLFELSVDRATIAGDTQAAVQQSLAERERSLQASLRQQEQLLQAQRTGLDRRLADMRRELVQIEAEAAIQQQRLELAQQSQARLESLRNENFISDAALQAKAEELLGQKAQLQALERQRAAQLREIGTLETQQRELPLQAEALQRQTERSLAALSQESVESAARQRIVIRAPQDGVLTTVLAEVGQSVQPNVALASLMPARAKLEAHLYAPSSAIGFLRPDQPVQLRYQAYAYQKFGHYLGHVLQVSRTPLQANELAGLALSTAATGAGAGALSGGPNAGEPLYRITVALDRQDVSAYGQAQPLAPGMQLEADVLLDRRRLIEWLFEPVLGVAGRV
ncbi:MAG: HlyD family efflux transporter periplasmic adaptor subunit [Burkholderiaceae bacterium]|nr:HlyD family efflux transporter periplasmic adaptor subunit [Burkholderiaceae bacterium]